MSRHDTDGPDPVDLGLGDLNPTNNVNEVNKRLLALRSNPRCHVIGPGVKSLVKLERIPESYSVEYHCFMFDPTLDDREKHIKGPHVYRENSWEAGYVALKHPALAELWTAADGKYMHSERVDDGKDPHLCCYRWIGNILSLSGQPIVKSGTIEVDLREGSERARSLKTGVGKARQYIVSSTESRAQNKAIREALGIEQTYTQEAVAYPFVLVKLVFRPDMSDPVIRFLVTANAIGAANSVFGGSAGAEMVRQLISSKIDNDEPRRLAAGDQKKLEGNAEEEAPSPSGRVEQKPVEQKPAATPPADTSDPFAFAEPAKPKSIASMADYLELEANSDPKTEQATPEMIAALKDLQAKFVGAVSITRPPKTWLKAHRAKFISILVEKGYVAK